MVISQKKYGVFLFIFIFLSLGTVSAVTNTFNSGGISSTANITANQNFCLGAACIDSWDDVNISGSTYNSSYITTINAGDPNLTTTSSGQERTISLNATAIIEWLDSVYAQISDLSSYILTSDEGNLNVNSSNYWDNLDTPSDISGSEFWYNHTTIAQAYADANDDVGGNSSWNESYANGLYEPLGVLDLDAVALRDPNTNQQIVISNGTGNLVNGNGAGSLVIKTDAGTAGYLSFGNTADVGISKDGTINGYDYTGSFIFKQKASNPSDIGEFIWIEETGSWRFALPSSGAGYGTYNPRSMIIAGPSLDNATNFFCNDWGFDQLDCDTSGTGADLGVQDDLQVLGSVCIGSTCIDSWDDVNISGSSYNATYDMWAYNMTTPVMDYVLSNEDSWLSTYNVTYHNNQANNSWNESYANTLYAGIEWDYNQTTPVMSYITSNEDSWLSTYNVTYHNNQANNSWNESYASTLYADIIWGYNQSTPVFSYITSQEPSWLSTYNVTYHNNQGDNASWNESYANTLYAPIGSGGDNSSWNESYASTLYADITWGYNMTTPAISYVDGNFVPDGTADAWIIKYQNISNIPTCSGTDKLTFDGTTLSCATDEVGAGGNASWNESYASTLYSDIQWNYNQTTPVMDYVLSNEDSWLSTYNSSYLIDVLVSDANMTVTSSGQERTVGLNATAITDWLDSIYAKISDLTDYILSSEEPNLNVNSSNYWDDLDTPSDIPGSEFWYNQTTPVMDYITSQEPDWLSTYNVTYHNNQANASWNESYASTLYADIIWGYNMSTPVFDYITSQEPSWLSTYNVTYHNNQANASWNESYASTLYSDIQWNYNQTTPVMDYVLANEDNWLGTFNDTYDTWAYNQTTPAISYADETFITNEVDTLYNVTSRNATTSYNITLQESRLCLNVDCSSYVWNNGTSVIIT